MYAYSDSMQAFRSSPAWERKYWKLAPERVPGFALWNRQTHIKTSPAGTAHRKKPLHRRTPDERFLFDKPPPARHSCVGIASLPDNADSIGDEILLEGFNPTIRLEFLETMNFQTIRALGGIGKDFDDQTRRFAIVGFLILLAATCHDVGIIETGIIDPVNPHLHVRHEHLARLRQTGIEQTTHIDSYQIMPGTAARHGVYLTVDIFMANGPIGLAIQVVGYAERKEDVCLGWRAHGVVTFREKILEETIECSSIKLPNCCRGTFDSYNHSVTFWVGVYPSALLGIHDVLGIVDGCHRQ